MNTVRRDADNAVSTLEGEIDSLGNACIDDLSSYFRDVQSAFSTLENEVGYLSAEHEEFEDELDEWRGLGDDPESVQEELDKVSDLEAAAEFVERDKQVIEQAKQILVEFGNLKQCHANQCEVIEALLGRLKAVNDVTGIESVTRLIADTAQPKRITDQS